MKRNVFFQIALISVLALCFAGQVFAAGGGQQAAPQSGPVTITFVNWFSVEEGTQKSILALMDAFQKENPNITVKNQGIAVSDVVKELTIMCAAGNPPDASQLLSDNVVQLQSAGFLAAVDNLLSASFKADLYPDLWDVIGLIGGKHYAVPWTITSNGLLYNRKLMQQAGLDPNKPPKNIDELTAMMKQAKQRLPNDVIMLQTDTTVRTIGLHHEWPFMLAFNDGVPPYTLDGKVNFNTPGIRSYMEWMRWMVNEKMTLPGLRYGQFRPYAAQNKLLFAHDGSYFDGIVRALDQTGTLTPQVFFETWGATAPPAGKDGKFRVPAQTHSMIMFEKSNKKDATVKFLEYMIGSTKALTDYIAPAGFTPTIKSALTKAPEIAKNPIVSAFLKDVVPASVTMPTGPDYASYAEVIMTCLQETITTTRNINDILADGQKKLEALFKK